MSPPSFHFPKHFTLRLVSIIVSLASAITLLWAFLALSVSFPIPVLRWPVALGLAGVAISSAIRLRHRPFGPALAFCTCTVPVFLWWLTLTPRNDRRWQPDMEKTSWAEISGDQITLHNFRNTDRRTTDDFTPRWETRSFRLSALKGLDFFMVYWGSPHICHTMITFDFGVEGRVCASIEARREQNEDYSPLAGAFRQYELIYVLGDERDLVRLRADLKAATDQVYLFRIPATPEVAQAIFLDYLQSTNHLHAHPDWYHSLTTNCSTLIREHVNKAHIYERWDWRILANGHLDKLLYAQGYLDQSLPLPELKARSLINPAARAAGNTPDFSDRIRSGLPGF